MLNNQLFLSLITGVFVGGVSAYLGSLMISKRMALVGDALGHVALPGIGLGLLWGVNTTFGAFIFLLAGILSVWFLEKKTELSVETLIGVIFVLSLAVGFLITPEPELLHALIGDISRVSAFNSAISVVVSILIFFAAYKIYPKVMLASFAEELAAAEKINIRRYNLIYLFLIAVVVALGVRVTGSLLVGALVIIPAAASRNLSKNLRGYAFGSILIGILSSILGILFSRYLNFPAGPMIILMSISIFLISLVLKSSRA